MNTVAGAEHWSQVREKGVYLGLWFMLRVYGLFGRIVFSIFLYPVVSYFFIAGRRSRWASHKFLARVQSFSRVHPLGDQRLTWRHTYRHFLAFGDAILDKFAAWSGEIRSEDVIYENKEVFDELIRSGRGALLIASHLGNSEVSRAIGSLVRDLKIVVLVHTRHSENFNRVMRKVNPDSQVSLIQTVEVGPDTAIYLQGCISRGEFVVIAGDRTPVLHSDRVSWAPFLGQLAPFPQGPYIIASLLKCPVLLIFCLKRAGKYHIIFEHFERQLSLPRRARGEVLDKYVACYAARLTYYAERHPYQWFNFFDFWNQVSTMRQNNKAEIGQPGGEQASPQGRGLHGQDDR